MDHLPRPATVFGAMGGGAAGATFGRTFLATATSEAAGGATAGAVSALQQGGDVLEGAGRGFVLGAAGGVIGGAVAGGGLQVAGLRTGARLSRVAAWGMAGVASDAGAQATALALGWQDRYYGWRSVAGGLVGAGMGVVAGRPESLKRTVRGANRGADLVAGLTDALISQAADPLTIAANSAKGNPAAIARGLGSLSGKQAAVLEQIPEFGARTVAGKSFGQRDLAALTAATGDEFAMFTTGGRRLIIRGNAGGVPVTPDLAGRLAGQGWRWSGHTHPGFESNVLRSSLGDRAVLGAMGQGQSAIMNSSGRFTVFTPQGDSLLGWKP